MLACIDFSNPGPLDAAITDDRTLISPVDDNNDRRTYFERCWPDSKHLDSFEIKTILVEGTRAIVRYRATTCDGRLFRNVECFTAKNGKIHHIEIYFGSDSAESVRSSGMA